MHGQHFPSNNAVTVAMKQWVNSIGALFFFKQAQHPGSCSSLAKLIANNGNYAEKYCFVAENVLYQVVLLCSLL